jgi:hypothetical protein
MDGTEVANITLGIKQGGPRPLRRKVIVKEDDAQLNEPVLIAGVDPGGLRSMTANPGISTSAFRHKVRRQRDARRQD